MENVTQNTSMLNIARVIDCETRREVGQREPATEMEMERGKSERETWFIFKDCGVCSDSFTKPICTANSVADIIQCDFTKSEWNTHAYTMCTQKYEYTHGYMHKIYIFCVYA